MNQIQYFLIAFLCVPLFAQQTYVPDNNFEAYLEENGMGNGIANDDSVTTANIDIVTHLYIQSQNISDLTGIGDFLALTQLWCFFNQLTSLDVSNNTALTQLYCYNNQLTSLDVSNNTALTQLYCYNNQLTILDVSQNTALTYLQCYNNSLTSLDVSGNTALYLLRCYNNSLTSLDVSGATALGVLNCSSNQLNTLDVSGAISLVDLRCNINSLTSLDLSLNTALTTLWCQNNQLSTLDLRNGNSNQYQYYVSSVFGSGYWVSGIKVFNNPNLTCINVDDPIFSTTYWGTGNGTGDIDPQHYFSANCSSNCTQTTSIPDANFEAYLETHDANGNTSTWPNTMGDGYPNNGLVCTANIDTVTTLNVENQGIANMSGLEDFTAISYLRCNGNSLTNLDVSANLNLSVFYCYENELTSLDVSNNPALTILFPSYNNLTELDVSANLLIEKINFGFNALTSFDVTNNPALWYLGCRENELTELDLRNGNNTITSFSSTGNSDLLCIDVDDVAWADTTLIIIDPWTSFNTDCSSMPVSEEPITVTEFKFHDAYPNPFNPRTSIRYDLPKASNVSISIYDLMGRKVRNLVTGQVSAGSHITQWDASNDMGSQVSAGVYIYTISADDFREVKKMILLK